MNISSISALSANFGDYYSMTGGGYGNAGPGGAGGSKSVTTSADGATVTTVRGAGDAVVSVTTIAPPTSTAPGYGAVAQSTESVVDITA